MVRWSEGELEIALQRQAANRRQAIPPKPAKRVSSGGKSALVEELLRQLSLARLPDPVTELRFGPPRRWRFDLAWPDAMLAVEVDGGIWNQGRHARGTGIENDCRKGAAAMTAGWRVLRVTGSMISEGEALNTIEALLGRIQ